MVLGLHSLLLSTAYVWDHVSNWIVDWEARFIFWQAGCRATLQVTSALLWIYPSAGKPGKMFHPPPAQPKPIGWLVCSWQRHLIPPSLVDLPCCLIYFSPHFPLYDTWLQTTAFSICPTKFYIPDALKGTSASASYHVLVSKRMPNDNWLLPL